MPGTTLSGQLCAWISNFTVTNLAIKKSLTTETPEPFFVKICHVGVFTAHDHLEKDPHRYLMSKFLEKKEAIMITNKPAHEHKFNSDCFARFLVYMFCSFSNPVYMLCSFSNPVICTMCLLLHTLFLLFVVCPKCRLFFLFPHPLNHARNLVATARSVRGGGAHFQFGTEIQLPT